MATLEANANCRADLAFRVVKTVVCIHLTHTMLPLLEAMEALLPPFNAAGQSPVAMAHQRALSQALHTSMMKMIKAQQAEQLVHAG